MFNWNNEPYLSCLLNHFYSIWYRHPLCSLPLYSVFHSWRLLNYLSEKVYSRNYVFLPICFAPCSSPLFLSTRLSLSAMHGTGVWASLGQLSQPHEHSTSVSIQCRDDCQLSVTHSLASAVYRQSFLCLVFLFVSFGPRFLLKLSSGLHLKPRILPQPPPTNSIFLRPFSLSVFGYFLNELRLPVYSDVSV